MPRFLVFHLHGPMQAWGGIGIGEVRGDHGYPSKSGVLGLIAAALGVTREDEAGHADLHQKLGFAVRVLRPGVPLRDFHTAQVPGERRNARRLTRAEELAGPKLNTILSRRDYRSDAVYTVALWEKEVFELDRIVAAFKKPRFQLFLGRKSCPVSLPIKPVIVEADNLVDLFAALDPPAQMPRLAGRTGRQVYTEPGPTGLKPVSRAPRHDRLLSRERWTFSTRDEDFVRLPEEDGS